MNYEFATIIVTAAMADRVKQVSRLADEDESDDLFITGLSVTGNTPATHYISSGMVPIFYKRLMENGTNLKGRVDSAMAKRGQAPPFTQLQINNALAKCDISFDPPFVALDRLGLKMIAGSP